MIFWIILFIIVFAMSNIYKDKIFLVWIFIWLVTAFRYKVGTDYMGYVDLFKSFNAGSMNAHYVTDVGLNFILNFMHSIGAGEQMLFFIYGTLTIIFYYKAFRFYAKGNTTLNILFVVLYMGLLFFQTLSIIRFMLAGAILLYGTKFIVFGSFIRYFITIGFAMMFHLTAIIFLPLYLVRYIKINNYLLPFFLIISFLIIYFHPLTKIISILLGENSPYMYYLTSEKYANIHASLFGIVNTFIYIGFAFVTIKYFKKAKELQIVFLFFLVFIFFRVLSIDMFIFQRISQYFKPFLIVYLGYLVVYLKFNEKIPKQGLFILLIYGVLAGALYGLSVRDVVQKRFYTQYAIDIGLFGDKYPIQIYGDYHKLPDYWE